MPMIRASAATSPTRMGASGTSGANGTSGGGTSNGDPGSSNGDPGSSNGDPGSSNGDPGSSSGDKGPGASSGTVGGDPSTSTPGVTLRMDLLAAGEGSTGFRGITPFSDGTMVAYGYERLATGNIDGMVLKID